MKTEDDFKYYTKKPTDKIDVPVEKSAQDNLKILTEKPVDFEVLKVGQVHQTYSRGQRKLSSRPVMSFDPLLTSTQSKVESLYEELESLEEFETNGQFEEGETSVRHVG
mgnify:CR=1 FL=1